MNWHKSKNLCQCKRNSLTESVKTILYPFKFKWIGHVHRQNQFSFTRRATAGKYILYYRIFFWYYSVCNSSSYVRLEFARNTKTGAELTINELAAHCVITIPSNSFVGSKTFAEFVANPFWICIKSERKRNKRLFRFNKMLEIFWFKPFLNHPWMPRHRVINKKAICSYLFATELIANCSKAKHIFDAARCDKK